MTSPPSDPSLVTEPPDCTRSRLAPALDVLAAVPVGLTVGVVGWAVAGGETDLLDPFVDEEHDNTVPNVVFAVTSLATAALFIASASSGFDDAAACQELHESFDPPTGGEAPD